MTKLCTVGYAIVPTGVVLGLLLLLGTALATQWSVELLVSAITLTNVRSYEALTSPSCPPLPGRCQLTLASYFRWLVTH